MTRVVILAALIAAAFLWHLYDRHNAFEEGASHERAIWRDMTMKAEKKATEDRLKAQLEIDKIEKQSLIESAARGILVDDLKKALADEKSLSSCGRVSRRLSDALRAIR